MTLRFERPPGQQRLEDEATLAMQLVARFALGQHPSEWEIGDALNQLGPLRARDVAVFLRSECLPRNPRGDAYTLDRLMAIAAIAARFPDGRRGGRISFSHYEELWRWKVRKSLCYFVLEIAARHGCDHKATREIIRDVRARVGITSEGLVTVPPMARWGTEAFVAQETTDDVQARLC